VLLIFAVVIWGTAHVKPARLRTVKNLITLSAIILFFSWSGTKLHVHMSDLVFSIVMLTTFSGTFVLNGTYLRFRRRAALKRATPQPEKCVCPSSTEKEVER
jgi:hypothetical protein